MNMNDYLPVIYDEVIYEDDYHKITKIAAFKEKCYVHTVGDKWYVKPDWAVEFTLTDCGRKIRPYRKGEWENIKYIEEEPTDVEIALKKEYEEVHRAGNYYLAKNTIDDVIHSSLFDSRGEIIVKGLFFLSFFNGNMLCEERNRIAFFIADRCGVMDFEGNVRIMPKYRNIQDIYKELIIMVDKGGYYFMTDQGDLVWEHHGSLASMRDSLITIWDEKPQILKYECKRKPENKKSYIHVNDIPISEAEMPRVSKEAKRLAEKLKTLK